MPTLTVKNVPPELHRRLKLRAERNRRSLNSEILECLRDAAHPRRVDPEALLAAARELRAKVRGRLTEARLRASKGAGRP
ncbi:MAG: FitA-like ribbon-helix-helix domain-containing protein [Myxococcota bacterium]